MKFCKRQRSAVPRSATDNRCNTLLAEFLMERLTPRQGNAQERAELAAQNLDIDENIQNEQVTIPEDLLFKIFILLPAESLHRIQFVCKKWFTVINCSFFIKCHAQKSETVLICQKLALSSLPFEGKPTSYFHFMDLEQGNDSFIKSNLVDFVEIFASCDGLVLAKVKNNKSLILANPVTRKHTELPLGTSNGFIDESYSLAFCNEEKMYKIVHLMYKTIGHIGCEIMSVGTREWKTIYGPSSDLLGLRDIKQTPVSIDGSLYWMPRINGCDYFVSMNVSNETFVTERLPSICSVNDRLVEFGGVLGLVTHATYQIMEVWFLKRGEDCEENWIKRYSISLMSFDFEYLKATCSVRNGKELVFGCIDNNLYAYNFDEGEMKLVYSRYYDNTEEWFDEGIANLYIPHRNMLTSWEDREVREILP